MNMKSRYRVVVASVLFTALPAAPSFAAAATTLPPKAAAATATTKLAAASTPTTKTPSGAAKTKAPVRAGNFCKKTLVGKISLDASGVSLTCKADAKGQPRWTK